MLIDHHKLVVDECLTWAARGEAHLGDRQSPTECLMGGRLRPLEQPTGGALIKRFDIMVP